MNSDYSQEDKFDVISLNFTRRSEKYLELWLNMIAKFDNQAKIMLD